MTEVRASRVHFYSPMDEDAFFEWLKKLPSIKEVYGEVEDIVLSFSEDPISDAEFHELIAIFRRYGVEKGGLGILVNSDNEGWVESWEPDIVPKQS